jgi:hypothetical protein
MTFEGNPEREIPIDKDKYILLESIVKEYFNDV